MSSIESVDKNHFGLTAPMLAVLLSLSAGILTADYVTNIPLNSLKCVICGLVLCSALCLWRRWKFPGFFILSVAFFWSGMALQQMETIKYYSYSVGLNPLKAYMDKGDVIRMEGVTEEQPVSNSWETALQARVRVETVWIAGKQRALQFPVLLRVYNPESFDKTWAKGDHIRFMARLGFPRGFRNEGSKPAIIYYWTRNISCLASCKSPVLITFTEKARVGVMHQLYITINKGINRVTDDLENRAILKALLLGQSLAAPDLRSAYVDAGIYHLLVISGLHLTLIALFLSGVLSIIRLPRLVHYLILISLLLVYVDFIQARVSIVRAFLIITIYIVGKAVYRKTNLLNAVSLAALILLVWQPWYIQDAGFQLTFMAVFALCLVYRPLDESLFYPFNLAAGSLFSKRVEMTEDTVHRRARWIRFHLEQFHFFRLRALSRKTFGKMTRYILRIIIFIGRMGLAAFAVLSFSAPILAAWHFPLSIGGIVLTLPALIIIWPTMILLLMTPFLSLLGDAPVHWALSAASALVDLLNSLVLQVSLPPFWMTSINPIVVCIFIVLLLWLLHGTPRRPVYAIVMVLVFFCILLIPFTESPDNLVLSMLDVGEGDCLLMSTPEGDHIMVDTGGILSFGCDRDLAIQRGDLSRRVIIPVLLEKGVRQLDALILTHFDFDHCGSALGLMKWFTVGKIYFSLNAWQQQSPLALDIARQARDQGISVQYLSSGDRLTFHSLTLDVLHPDADYYASDANRSSLVMLGKWGNNQFLLTGDIDKSVETRMMSYGLFHKVSVLKCAHHGSRTSTSAAFLDVTAPGLVLISSGTPWRFSHPAPSVVKRFRDRDIPWISTYNAGQIDVVFEMSGIGLEFPGPAGPGRKMIVDAGSRPGE